MAAIFSPNGYKSGIIRLKIKLRKFLANVDAVLGVNKAVIFYGNAVWGSIC